ncbi:transposase [Anaeromyxobacter oryzisoli]|uniref:transposase n=1 Tax=Anaeromyxobacter oryzisoli TaxID=2925408 RepID=UPI001F59402D|nr:transposase [Anaeromyxobacter sp. SG63]
MTAPRQVLKGTTYLVTRRCSERRYFLRPSSKTDAIFRYVLAVAAERCQIQVHAFCVLSNHFHMVVTDPHARLPEFHRYLDGLVARAINCALGRWESFWGPDSYSAVRLETADAIIEKMVYVLANPVAAGLVRRGREWPGLWSDPNLIGGEPIVAERPTKFFRKLGCMPASANLQLHRPPGFESDDAFARRLGKALRDAEDRAAAKLEVEGRSFLGAARVLAQKPHARPAPGEPRRGLNPRVACRAKWKRIEALQRLEEFGRAYQAALESWRTGVRDVLFPPGTWLMRVQHSALCGEACG